MRSVGRLERRVSGLRKFRRFWNNFGVLKLARVPASGAKDQIATDNHLVELVQQRRDAGIASDRELARAQAVLSQAKATVPLITVSLEAQLNRLDVLMGAQPGIVARYLSDQQHATRLISRRLLPVARRMTISIAQTGRITNHFNGCAFHAHPLKCPPAYTRTFCVGLEAIPNSMSHSLMWAPITSGWSSCK